MSDDASGGDLEATRAQLQQGYLGKAGIHGIGLSRARGAVRLYVDADAPPEQAAIIEQARQDAAPFTLDVVVEQRPRIGS